MKRAFIFLAITTLLVLFSGCAQKEPPVQRSAECDRLLAEITAGIETARACSSDSECGYSPLKCPWNSAIVNTGKDLSGLAAKVERYLVELGCAKIKCAEFEQEEIGCVEGKCGKKEGAGRNIIITHGCYEDRDCKWASINCCPEISGAEWQCINTGHSELDCRPGMECPEVISPKPLTTCACENDVCVERTGAPSLNSPPCGIQTKADVVLFEWTPADDSMHEIAIGRLDLGEQSEISAEQTAKGSFKLSEPLGDGEYYWKAKPKDENDWSEECRLTVARQKIICPEVLEEMGKCWQRHSEAIKDNETVYCGDLLGFENECAKDDLIETGDRDGRFYLALYEQCNRLAIFLNRSQDYEPIEEYYNKVIVECYEGGVAE